MDLQKMIVELQAERQRLDEAIEALERLSTGTLRRRGRPPRWLKEMERATEMLQAADPEPVPKKKIS